MTVGTRSKIKFRKFWQVVDMPGTGRLPVEQIQELQDLGWTIFSIGYDKEGYPVSVTAWKVERVVIPPPPPPVEVPKEG